MHGGPTVVPRPPFVNKNSQLATTYDAYAHAGNTESPTTRLAVQRTRRTLCVFVSCLTSAFLPGSLSVPLSTCTDRAISALQRKLDAAGHLLQQHEAEVRDGSGQRTPRQLVSQRADCRRDITVASSAAAEEHSCFSLGHRGNLIAILCAPQASWLVALGLSLTLALVDRKTAAIEGREDVRSTNYHHHPPPPPFFVPA